MLRQKNAKELSAISFQPELNPWLAADCCFGAGQMGGDGASTRAASRA
jgi:hypothetical protein